MSYLWMEFEEDAYELTDPKHPDFYDLACEKADLERKREKEGAFMCDDIDESGGVA